MKASYGTVLLTDPFGENQPPRLSMTVDLLGGRFRIGSDSAPLMRIARAAFAGLPAHRFSRRAPAYSIRLVLAPASKPSAAEPPPVHPASGAALLLGAMPSANFAAINPEAGAALVHISPDMLRFPYHLRYELLEFALYTLAARAQGLVALHAACVATGGRAALLLGDSGSGKSTLTLQCLLRGFHFLAEDSVLVDPRTLRATGLGNFLHIRTDSLSVFETLPAATRLARRAPVIRRRSGVKKFEIDLRRAPVHLAAKPLPLSALVFVTAKRATAGTLLQGLTWKTTAQRLAASQNYAAQQPGWREFLYALRSVPAFELRRGRDPAESAAALRHLLAEGPLLRGRQS